MKSFFGQHLRPGGDLPQQRDCRTDGRSDREKYRFLKHPGALLTGWEAADTTTNFGQAGNLFRVTEIGSWLLRGHPDKPPFPPGKISEALHVQGNLRSDPSNFPLEKQLYWHVYDDTSGGF